MAIRSRTMIHDHLAYVTLVGLRPRSIKSRREVLELFMRHVHPRSIVAATRRDVESFLSRPISASSRRTYLGHLRGFYRWAIDQEHLSEDPTAKVKMMPVRAGTPRPVTAQDFAVALEYATPRMRAWLLLMGLAGLRCLEVAALRPMDLIDADGQTLLYLRECKGGGTATLPAHEAILEALAVLPVRNGLWWSVSAKTVSTDTSRYLHELGIDATAHRLRHLAGTTWYRVSGQDLLTTAQLLRHAKVSTTQVYAAISPQRPAEVVNLVRLPVLAPSGSVAS